MSSKKQIFKDPILGSPLEVKTISAEDLEVAKFQRKPSRAHIKSLALSIQRMGFLVPLVVYREENKYIIVDGQHRFLAGQTLGMQEFLSVVIPKELGTKIINLNIEKQPNIREKAYVAYNLYTHLLEEKPHLKENEAYVEDCVEFPWYITLGFAYVQEEKFHGSAFENIISKCDEFLELPLEKAKLQREKRASLILEIDKLLAELINKMKEMNFNLHPFIRKDILTYVNPLKGRGKRGEFKETMESIKQQLLSFKKNPQELKKIESEDIGF